MASPSLFTELFSEGATVEKESMGDWFDTKTKTFGGKGAIQTVKDLIGHSEKFEYQDLKEIPPKDLDDLQPFFEAMLTLNKRRISRIAEGLAFLTPDEWLQDPGVRRRYYGVVFNRSIKGRDAAIKLIGVGHRAFDQALKQARNTNVSLAMIPGIEGNVAFFIVRDRVTEQSASIRQILFAVQQSSNDDLHLTILKDWEAIDLLNGLLRTKKMVSNEGLTNGEKLKLFLTQARQRLVEDLSNYNLPFDIPEVISLAILSEC